ncbi:tetratricopeptide repeat protein, partial [Streptomyces melanogenes]|uniref:tetratricopeptide repeat protein n=1 Tax=Streptomyces melanogenes TaxID=67326 RepID=UPI00378BDA9D
MSVFRPGQAASWTGTVVWRGVPGGRDDAALLLIEDASWAPLPGAVRWGRLVTHRPQTPCEAWGMPDLVQRPDRAVDTLQPSGTLNPGDRFVGNRYVMNLAQHPPAPPPDNSSPWGGMSGAALFCGDLLASVITCDPAGRQHASLEAVPAYVLMNDPHFRTALAEHAAGTGTELEPIEWQHLSEPADPSATRPLGSPAALLRARRQVVPFRGRTDILKQLHAWTREPGFGARLLHGPGGQGKTRLAQHLADQLATEGSTTLWLRHDTADEALAQLSAAAVALLVVVDYAEARTAQLIALLNAAARHAGTSPFKVLMLARTAGDWWPALHAATPLCEDLLDGAATLALPPFEPEPGTSRTYAYQQAIHSYAAQLPHVRGWHHHDWPALATQLTTRNADHARADRVLERPSMATALTLHMTALADLLDAATASVPPDTETTNHQADTWGAEDRLLHHERRYWTSTATAHGLHPALTLDTLTDALAAAFLLGAQNHTEAEALLKRVRGLTDQSTDKRLAVRAWIAALYPAASTTSPWDTLQPDRLAERFIGRRLQTHPGLADYLVRGATDTQAAQLLTVYTRTAAHTVFHHKLDEHLTALCTRHAATLAAPAIETATRTESPLPLLNALQQMSDNPATPLPTLEHLAARLPETSHNLAPFAANLAQCIANHHRDDVHEHPEQLPVLARSLNNLSVRLGDVGRREEALAAVNEAVDIWRDLARSRPDAFLPDLATCLNNLSADLGAVGRREEALAAVNEAVKVYRDL